jgi:hypothetical protein
VCTRRLVARARDPRVEIGLADPDDPFVGDDLDDDRVLGRARRAELSSSRRDLRAPRM